MQVRKLNLCFVYGNATTFEVTCDNDEFNKYGNKLKEKEVIGYIKEYVDSGKIDFFIKQALGQPYDFFRLKEFNYYDSRMWSYKKVKQDCFNTYMNYLFNKKDVDVLGGRKFLLKKVEEYLR